MHVVLIVCCCVVCTYSCYYMYVCTGKEEWLWPIVRLIINQSLRSLASYSPFKFLIFLLLSTIILNDITKSLRFKQCVVISD